MIYNTKNTYCRYTELSIAMPLIISITSFSIIENGRNDIKFRLKFNTDKLSIREAKIMSASTIFTIQNIENSTSLEKAIDEIKKFQKKYLKDHKGSIELNLLKNLPKIFGIISIEKFFKLLLEAIYFFQK